LANRLMLYTQLAFSLFHTEEFKHYDYKALPSRNTQYAEYMNY